MRIRHATAALILFTAVPLLAQQAGPVAPLGGEPGTAASTSLFPLWKSLLEGRTGFPPPYGINVVLMDLSGHWDVKEFSASVAGNEVASISGSANVHPFTYGARADVWVLPFLNVFVTAGGVKLNVQAIGEDLPLGISGIPPQVVHGDLLLDLDFTGYYGGIGGVVGGGWKWFFASVDGSAVWTHLVSQTSGVEGNELATYTASFRAGYNGGTVQPYVGGRWVKKIDHFEGTVEGPGGKPVTFAVDLKAPPWNYTVGVRGIIAGHFEYVIEAGFGDRTHGLVNLGYRF